MSKFFASNWPCQAPSGALLLHFVCSAILIIGPPSADAYSFLVTVSIYSFTLLQLPIGVGLLYLHHKSTTWNAAVQDSKGIRAHGLAVSLWALALTYILLASFVPWDNKAMGIHPSIPWYLPPVIGSAVMVLGVLYWVVWILIWPMFGMAVETEREVLPDGSERLIYRVCHFIPPEYSNGNVNTVTFTDYSGREPPERAKSNAGRCNGQARGNRRRHVS